MDLRTKTTVEEGIVLDETSDIGRVIEYQPGNGTRYLVLIQHLDCLSSKAHERIGCSADSILITTLTDPSNQRAVVAGASGLLHWSRLERLFPSVSDQIVVAEMVGHVMGLDHVTCEEYQADR